MGWSNQLGGCQDASQNQTTTGTCTNSILWKCSLINMRNATEVGRVHHIFSHFFLHITCWTLYATPSLCKHISKKAYRLFYMAAEIIMKPHYTVSYTCLARAEGNFHLYVLLTVEILDFFFNMDLSFPHFTPLDTFACCYCIKILIKPYYPWFSSCVVLYTTTSFNHNDAILNNQVT